MNEYKHIIAYDLSRTESKDKSHLLTTTDLYYPWYSTRDGKAIHIPRFKVAREDKLIEDLLNLASQGTDGYIELRSEEGRYIRLVLTPRDANTNVNVKAFRGRITYSDKPCKTFEEAKKEVI